MRLLIARHAETVWNVERRIQGWTDSGLSAHGSLQAKALAERLRTRKLSAIYSSDAGRACITAECVNLWHDLDVMQMEELRETSWGEWEGMTGDEIAVKYPEIWPKFVAQGRDGGPDEADWESTTLVPGGETMKDACERIGKGLQQIQSNHTGESDTVLVVGHGGSLRFLFVHALGLRPAYARRFHLDNTSLSEVWYMRGHPPVIHLLNDISHYALIPSK